MTTVWITGGKGFIGRNLAKFIAKQNTTVYGIGHGFWTDDDFRAWGFSHWINAEIDFAGMSQLVADFGKPNIIFHLAGGSAVGPSIQNPYEDFQRTVDTTARLLEWVRQNSPASRVIGVSSAAVYGSAFNGPISEGDNGKPFSPYGFHKWMLESLFSSYRDSFGLDVTVTRFFSVYGPGLEKQLLWDICQKIEKSKSTEITLNGTGNEIRDWLHISDATELLWLLVHKSPNEITVVNGGTGIGTSIAEIASMVCEQWGQNHKVNFSGISRKGDPKSLVGDISLANELGFSPRISLQQGISEVVTWYKARNLN